MSFWEGYHKYCGVQGTAALLLIGGFIYLSVTGQPVSEGYVNLMYVVAAFYFAKNGGDIVTKIQSSLKKG